MIDKALVNMIVTDLQPVSIVEDKGFKEFVQVIDQKYTPPSRRTIMRELLPSMYLSKRAELEEQLKTIEHCSITTDLWTSRATEGYITITAHFITNTWKMRSVVLKTVHVNESHTSENIAAVLTQVTDEWNVSAKVHCATTDNANNIKRAIRINKWNHNACFAHTLNLIVTDAIKQDEELAELIQKVKQIVTFFHKSTKANDNLKINQNRLNIPNHKLIQQVETRWNSAYYMLERYLEQQEAIRTTLCLMDKNDLIISTDKNAMIEELITVLQPFEAVTKEMSGEKYTSISKIIPISKALQRITSGHRDTQGSQGSLNDKLIIGMAQRFLNMEDNQLVAFATLLDPRFKKVAFTNKVSAENMSRQLVSESSTHHAQGSHQPEDSVPNDPPPSENPLWRFFDEEVASITTSRTPGISAYTEMQQYLKQPVVPRKEDPLEWWGKNAHIYPTIAKCALKYLCGLATSVPSERLFSKAGELISMRRSSIKPKNVDMHLFLNKME